LLIVERRILYNTEVIAFKCSASVALEMFFGKSITACGPYLY
jgi:hypothetical protein